MRNQKVTKKKMAEVAEIAEVAESNGDGLATVSPKPFNFAEFKRKNTFLAATVLNGMQVYIKAPAKGLQKKMRAVKDDDIVHDLIANYLAENVFTDSEGQFPAATSEEWASFSILELTLVFYRMQDGVVDDFKKNLSKETGS